MHFATVVILPKDDSATVESLMAPYDENGEWFKDGSRWDWYMVGGRWDGAMLGLSPLEVKETCSFCNGTGVSKVAVKNDDGTYHHTFVGGSEADYPYGCHVCKGSGEQDAWSTNEAFEDPARNQCLGSEVSSEFQPYAFISPDGNWHEVGRPHWFGTFAEDENGNAPTDEETWTSEWDEAKQQYSDHTFVLLDCHV